MVRCESFNRRLYVSRRLYAAAAVTVPKSPAEHDA
jgi:hypothetical protein